VEKYIEFLSHPSEQEWEEYAFGRVPEAKAAVLEEHLLCCADCLETFEPLDDYVQMMRRAAPEIREQRKSIFPAWLKLPVRSGVAAVAMAVAFTLVCVAVASTWRSIPSGPLAYVALASLRGQSAAVAPPNRPLVLRMSEPTGRQIGIFDLEGTQVAVANVRSEDGQLTAQVPKGLAPGVYWVRLFGGGSVLIREFSLRIE
jgi:hypothetical protein